MKKRMGYLLVMMLFAIILASYANAGEGDIGHVYVENVGAIVIQSGGHMPGNFEIKIKNGFALPSGVVCDSTYITTKKTTDPDKMMFALLVAAQLTNRPVDLRITDDPTYMAFGGRCSLVWAGLTQ